MKGYVVPLTCPHCGADCEPVARSEPKRKLVTEVSAVARCTGCRRSWAVLVQLRAGPMADESRRQRTYRGDGRRREPTVP